MAASELERDIIISEITLVVNKILPKDWENPRSDRPYHGFINVAGGSLSCEYSDKTKVFVTTGEMIYLPKGSSYHLKAEGDDTLEYFIVNFALERDDDLLTAMLERHIVPTNKIKTASKFERLDELYFYMPPGYRVEMLSILYSILCDALSASRTHASSSDGHRIMPAIKYFRENYASDCILSEAAGLCGISVSHMRRLFHDYYGLTPKKYVTLLRIAGAKKLLTSTNLPIYEISERCGFNDAAYFCKIFRAETGTTPYVYRKGNGTGIEN